MTLELATDYRTKTEKVIHRKPKCKTASCGFKGGYVHHLAGRGDLLQPPQVGWKPHSDDKTPGIHRA